MKLNNILEIKGTLKVLTGLRIGTGNTEMHIGGTDNPVIRHPHTNEPYIPGSSLKGKIRSLLEWRAGLAAINDGKPMSYEKLGDAPDRLQAEQILKLFGVSGGDELTQAQSKEIGPTRLSFRDCALERDWVEGIKQKNLPLTEIKMENTIDRVRGTAEHPRNMERVPAGAVFEFTVMVKQLDMKDENDLLKLLWIGLNLLGLDSLGGSGSRGYGRVELTLDNAEWNNQLKNAKPW